VSCEANDGDSVVDGPDDGCGQCGDSNAICSSTVSCCASNDRDDALRIAWRYKNLHMPVDLVFADFFYCDILLF